MKNQELIKKMIYNNLITLQQISKFVVEKGGKCTCGQLFKETDIRNYDHPYGYVIEGYSNKQWIYFHCTKCDCDLALWKILDRIALEEMK